MAAEQKPIPIDALNPQQLMMIKKNIEEVAYFTLPPSLFSL